MTPEQRSLARHALGLPNSKKQSYRNRYFTGRNHSTWEQMVYLGYAKLDPVIEAADRAFFFLTRKGAELALDKGEKLCPEDFP